MFLSKRREFYLSRVILSSSVMALFRSSEVLFFAGTLMVGSQILGEAVPVLLIGEVHVGRLPLSGKFH